MVSLINGPLMLAMTKRCLASVSPPQLRVSLDDFSSSGEGQVRRQVRHLPPYTLRRRRGWDRSPNHFELSHFGNDPSAGSPTETLLRLLLPLNNRVRSTFKHFQCHPKAAPAARPKTSLYHSIGSSDGRCVQRAGT
jgi:hypothetical protein